MSFIKMIDQEISETLIEILQHPFLQELSAGTLKKSIFHFYLEQDYYYLSFYKEALLALSRQAKDITDKKFFKYCAECCTHEPAFEIKEQVTNDGSRKTAACIAYIDFIKKAIAQNYVSGMFSVFPCFYIYYLVAKVLYPKNGNNHFIHWFQTYVSPLFTEQTHTMIVMLEKEYDQCTTIQRKEMLELIKLGAKHEWHFWDETYL